MSTLCPNSCRQTARIGGATAPPAPPVPYAYALVQDNFLTQHVLEPTRAARVLDIVLSSQKEFVDNVVIQEPLGSSDHNQLHFNINIKSDKTKVKQCRRDFRRGNYDEIRKRLALIDWNDKMNNKTATECWNILRGELDSAIDSMFL